MQEAGAARKIHNQKLDGIGDRLAQEILMAEYARKRAEAEFQKNEAARLDAQKRAIMTWIDGIDSEDDKEKARFRRHQGTGIWLFDRKEFEDWFSGTSCILWLTGKPGCGLYSLSIMYTCKSYN